MVELSTMVGSLIIESTMVEVVEVSSLFVLLIFIVSWRYEDDLHYQIEGSPLHGGDLQMAMPSDGGDLPSRMRSRGTSRSTAVKKKKTGGGSDKRRSEAAAGREDQRRRRRRRRKKGDGKRRL
ncbi:hypothetical protein QYF36_005770 [Acer negundo]|nr:hypothetical protein QYF36_005770 [Acer negundo]